MPHALRVLMVEDHAFQRRLGLKMLGDLGVGAVLEAADGPAALAVLDAAASPVDIVLVDLDLPGMDGVELIRLIAERRSARAVAVVSALDAAVQHTIALMARAAGLRMLGCVEKPLTPDRLRDLFNAYATPEAGTDAGSDDAHVLDRVGEALGAGEVLPYFQPKVEMRNGRVIGVEALARWRQPDGRVLSAGQFIQRLEAGRGTAMLCELTLRESARHWRQWRAAGLDLQVAVNLCAADLVDPGVADRYEDLLREAGMPPERLVFELTESSAIGDTVRGLGVLARLRLKGFGLSIDDFGTGYSSLSQLAQLPFTELKIDRSFVSAIERMPKNRATVAASIDLARRLKLSVVAEGVERSEEWSVLAELGCDVAQGWLVAPAVPPEDLPAVVSRWSATAG
jgi:EAL domain-containing protein (putative c-di-GMP-specific phosphodiesterase class I)/FixJ family two-component response regulator